MTDIPIIFSAPMIRALIEGRKTQTRRLAWLPPRDPSTGRIKDSYQRPTIWQRVEPGDRLWVRESVTYSSPPPEARYVADDGWVQNHLGWNVRPWWKWEKHRGSPSIHMPRWASRLTIIVTDTKVESLQEITEGDAMREGVLYTKIELPPNSHEYYIDLGGGEMLTGWTGREVYASLWQRLHGAGSWNANPEVVAMTFRVIKANIDSEEARAA